MAWSEREVEVDRDLVLNVDVLENGVVRLQLIGGGVKAELGPGDRFTLVLRPLKPDENQSNPVILEETWNNGPDFPGYHDYGAGTAGAAPSDEPGDR